MSEREDFFARHGIPRDGQPHNGAPQNIHESNRVELDMLYELASINYKLGEVMAAIDDLKAAVAADDATSEAAVTYIQELAAQLAALPTDDSTALEALTSDVQSHADALQAAITPAPIVPPATVDTDGNPLTGQPDGTNAVTGSAADPAGSALVPPVTSTSDGIVPTPTSTDDGSSTDAPPVVTGSDGTAPSDPTAVDAPVDSTPVDAPAPAVGDSATALGSDVDVTPATQ